MVVKLDTTAGCQEARNMITIEEVSCPNCHGTIEVFGRDGLTVVESSCDVCGYVIPASSSLAQLPGQNQMKENVYAKEEKTEYKPCV